MDDFLKQLRHPPPVGLLDGVDDNVLAMLSDRRRETGASYRLMALAAVVSLGWGAFAGVTTRAPIVAARALSPFAPSTALAPSTLLDAR